MTTTSNRIIVCVGWRADGTSKKDDGKASRYITLMLFFSTIPCIYIYINNVSKTIKLAGRAWVACWKYSIKTIKSRVFSPSLLFSRRFIPPLLSILLTLSLALSLTHMHTHTTIKLQTLFDVCNFVKLYTCIYYIYYYSTSVVSCVPPADYLTRVSFYSYKRLVVLYLLPPFHFRCYTNSVNSVRSCASSSSSPHDYKQHRNSWTDTVRLNRSEGAEGWEEEVYFNTHSYQRIDVPR